ncbi:uncharacterized protein LOC118438139 [Folsomia candida]|uniref:F-box domain-containing protein n=1 Tax=Folsomia candida TaxID=158441 RepID=A0A226DKF8_FOLCA|nr:uncharacterized protein LOC118438139 [Folsomia candida]OXA45091.1 hypothetical protein Fcan01_20366 [Folsomia candida]
MDLSGNHGNPHLAVVLPEILAKIATFLPKSDLLSCTLINSTWETEVRKLLFDNVRIVLTPEKIFSHKKIVPSPPFRGSSIGFFSFASHLSGHGPCANYVRNHGAIVKTITTSFFIKAEAFTLPKDLELVAKSFPNATTLELDVNFWSLGSTYESLIFPPPKRYSFSKVKTLEIATSTRIHNLLGNDNLTYCTQLGAIFAKIIPRLVPLLPNVEALSFFNSAQTVVENFLDLFSATVTTLKMSGVTITAPMQRPTILNLTRLEIGCYYLDKSNFSHVLKFASETLQHVKFSEVENVPVNDKYSTRYAIVFPVMRKLRVFELVQNKFTDRSAYKNSLVRPKLILRWEGGRGHSGTRLVYQDQFPVLETVRISRNETHHLLRNRGIEDRLTEQEYFEASVTFLYETFLREGNSRSESVKRLDVPFPPEAKFRLEKCEGGNGECYEWRDSSEFWDRAVEMFPNLVKYAAIGESRERMRAAGVKEWVKLGEKLGFVRGKERKGSRI